MKEVKKLKLKKPDYGVDAPGIIRNIILMAIISGAVGGYLLTFKNQRADLFSDILFVIARINILQVILGILYVKIGKFKHRDRMLNLILWKGDEHVLDVGTGRGLLMIGAAKRLNTGKSTGIDIWKRSDLKNNTYEKAMHNAILEGVEDKIEIKYADAQEMPFNAAEFDVVLSNLCLHNISTRQGREEACREIVRVLKPGGTAIISDIMHTSNYTSFFVNEALKVVWKKTFVFETFLLPLTVVKVVKEKTV